MATFIMTVDMVMCGPENTTGKNYTRPLLEIEKNFDRCKAFLWHRDNWTLCYQFIGLYLAAIFVGRWYMRSRPPFQLRTTLLLWNTALAIFSIVSTWRMLTAVIYNVRSYGFLDTVCHMERREQRQSFGFWMFLFMLSKILEFGDTAFIVLRKSPLIFLHWYHHVTVAFLVWSTGAYASPMQVYYCLFNLIVHSIMYSYYALRALRVHIPKAVSMSITSLQLIQMVGGMFITGYAYLAKLADPTCFVPDEAIAIAAGIYLSYFVLFLNFFFRAYVSRRTPQAAQNGQCKKTK